MNYVVDAFNVFFFSHEFLPLFSVHWCLSQVFRRVPSSRLLACAPSNSAVDLIVSSHCALKNIVDVGACVPLEIITIRSGNQL